MSEPERPPRPDRRQNNHLRQLIAEAAKFDGLAERFARRAEAALARIQVAARRIRQRVRKVVRTENEPAANEPPKQAKLRP